MEFHHISIVSSLFTEKKIRRLKCVQKVEQNMFPRNLFCLKVLSQIYLVYLGSGSSQTALCIGQYFLHALH